MPIRFDGGYEAGFFLAFSSKKKFIEKRCL